MIASGEKSATALRSEALEIAGLQPICHPVGSTDSPNLADSGTTLFIRVLVTNPSDHDIIVETGGPPFTIAGDPTQSAGLSTSVRIASPTDPLGGGPTFDSWGGSRDTIPDAHFVQAEVFWFSTTPVGSSWRP